MLAIYTRLSREDKDSTSIENQIKEGKEFAQLNHFKDFKIYNEGEGVSGKLEIEKRPVFSLLLTDILQRKIKAVWFRNQNRSERNGLSFFLFVDACKKTKTRIFYADNEFNYNDATEFLHKSLTSILNEYSPNLQSEQTQKVLLSRVKEGKVHGVPAYGYTKDPDGKMIIDKKEATTIKLIYKLSLSGKGYDAIAKHLNDKGIPTRYSQLKGTYEHTNKYTGETTIREKSQSTWSGKSISDKIKNPLYKGERKWKDEVVEVPPIVPAEYWQQVNDNLKNNRNNSGKKVEHKYLLKGLLSCGKCGRNYYGRSRVNKKDHYYQCSSKRITSCGNRSINIDRLEEYIWFQLFVNGNIVEQIKCKYRDNDTEKQVQEIMDQISFLNTKKKGLKTKIQNSLKLMIEGETGKKLIDEIIADYEKEILDIDKELDLLQGNLELLLKSEEIIKKYDNEFQRLTHTTNFQEKKEIVQTFIKRITILSKGKSYYLKIEFNIDIPPKGGLYIQSQGFMMPSSLDNHYLKEFDKMVTTPTPTSLIV